MSYKIKNISGHLQLLGLFPGESKIINSLADDVKILYNRQLISIDSVVEKQNTVITKKKNSEDESSNLKECEVEDTDGRN